MQSRYSPCMDTGDALLDGPPAVRRHQGTSASIARLLRSNHVKHLGSEP